MKFGRQSEPAAQENALGFDSFEFVLGDLLRGERATKGKSLLDVQRDLKINASVIAAIEACDMSAFQTAGFISGFVRAYARYLGMDQDWVYDRFCVEAGYSGNIGLDRDATDAVTSKSKTVGTDKQRTGDVLAEPRTAFLPPKETFFSTLTPRSVVASLVLVCLISGLGFGAWQVLLEVQRVNITSLSETPAITAANVPVDATNVEDAERRTATLDLIYNADGELKPVVQARDGPIARLDPQENGVFAPGSTSGSTSQTETVVVGEITPDVAVNKVVGVLASRPAWVQIATTDGKVLFEDILSAEQFVPLPEIDAQIVLRSGNSGSVFVKMGEDVFGPVGEGTSVVRNVSLAPVDIIQSFEIVTDDKVLRPLRRASVVTQASGN